jgi:hypothetical protein
MPGSVAWIVASVLDWNWATVVIIVVSAVTPIELDKAGRKEPEKGDRLFVLWPLGRRLALTVASAINVLTVLRRGHWGRADGPHVQAYACRSQGAWWGYTSPSIWTTFPSSPPLRTVDPPASEAISRTANLVGPAKILVLMICN